jgi:hypothetical protein
MGIVEWIVLAFVVGVVLWLLWRLWTKRRAAMVAREMYWMQKVDDATRTLMDFNAEVKACLPDSTRYEVRLADWGPDFTGFDGILPRWRWAVVDADIALRTALGLPIEVGTEELPLMLGNAFTAEEALVAAVRWIETQQHPEFVLGEVTPWRVEA